MIRLTLCLLLMGATLARAQEPRSGEPAAAATLNGGFYLGAGVGWLGGSATPSADPSAASSTGSVSLFHAYDLVDGSGSHFGSMTLGYRHRLTSGLVLGADTDISFGAQPVVNGSPVNETTEVFGAVRARVGYGPRHWFAYGTGGLAWTRDQIAVAGGSSTFDDRVGWTIGGGVERALAGRWSVDGRYTYARFTSDVSTHQAQVGLNYTLGGDAAFDGGRRGQGAFDLAEWNVHAQTTYLNQYAPPFRAPYRGANSLDTNIGRETWDVTFYLGRRLWTGAALWINPEIDQGFGLSNTLGVAGFTSGEAYKVGHTSPYVRIPRAFVQQTVDLGGERQTVEAGLNQFVDSHTANRLVATIGKLSVSDLFDTISYAHDPRSDFMNWSLVDAGTFDYAADAWGFTYGGALEWYRGVWVARAGLFDLSLVPNSVDLDTRLHQFQVVYELEHQHTVNGQPGKVSLVGFLSRGRMGRYDDALAFAEQRGKVPETADVRRYDSRPGINLNVAQQIASGIGVFGRVGWADGRVEPYEFTDIDRTASAGISVEGRRWRRGDDTAAVAAVVNGVTDSHAAYLAAGGLGILVGDGRLPHPGRESIVESYYRLPIGPWQLTFDYQFVVNPAFNRDRGPVSVVSARVRALF
jgi:high affinity Mn2+ porin